MHPSGMYPKISNNFIEFTPTNKHVDFFFLFGILMVKYVTVLANTPMPSVGLKGRQFLRTIKFNAGCSVRGSHSPPSCGKKRNSALLPFPSPSPHTPCFLPQSLSSPSLCPHYTFLLFSSCPVHPSTSICAGG